MLYSYFKIMIRNLMRKKLYSIINILGLALGIASFLIILLYVTDELGYDRYHSKADRIYRIGMVYDFGGVGEESASLPFPFAFTFKEEYPDQVENTVRIFNFQNNRNLIEYGDKSFDERHFFFGDSTFFSIFDHKFIKGNPATALDEPNSVVLTESAAVKYFGDKDPIGEILKFEVNIPL
jgi:putative ABC transport system permease protein